MPQQVQGVVRVAGYTLGAYVAKLLFCISRRFSYREPRQRSQPKFFFIVFSSEQLLVYGENSEYRTLKKGTKSPLFDHKPKYCNYYTQDIPFSHNKTQKRFEPSFSQKVPCWTCSEKWQIREIRRNPLYDPFRSLLLGVFTVSQIKAIHLV